MLSFYWLISERILYNIKQCPFWDVVVPITIPDLPKSLLTPERETVSILIPYLPKNLVCTDGDTLLIALQNPPTNLLSQTRVTVTELHKH